MTRQLFQFAAILFAKFLRGFWWSTELLARSRTETRTWGMNLSSLRGCPLLRTLTLWERRVLPLKQVGVTSRTVEGEEKRRREWGTQNVKSAKKVAHRLWTVGSSILHHKAFPFSWGFPLVLKQHTYFWVSILLNKLKISYISYIIQIYLSFSYFLKFYSMATYREFKCHYHYDRLQDWGGR